VALFCRCFIRHLALILLMAFYVILNTSIAQAQILRAYGLKAGFILAEQRWHYSPQSGIDASGIGPVWGFDTGGFVEFFNFPNFSLLTELRYLQRGRTVTVNGVKVADTPQGYIDLGQQEIQQRFEYISIPVLVKIRFGNERVTPYVALGPRLEYLISYPSSSVYDQFNKFELAASVAAGTAINFGIKPRLLCEFHYSQSINNSFKNEFVTVNNRSLSFLIGLEF